MDSLISIVVPVYQSERYLSQCIDSILLQTYTNFELILVDDGSNDASGEICERYASQDKRIRVFHQRNSGVSSARNKGIVEACGEWLTFIDSDDYVSPQYISDLYKQTKDGRAILIMQGFANIVDGTVVSTNELGSHYISENEMEKLFSQLNIYENGHAVGKLYNLSVIKSFAVRFNPRITYAEDLIFMLTYILHIKEIVILPQYNYFYRIDASTLSQKYNSFESEYLTFSEFQRLNKLIAERFSFNRTLESFRIASIQLMRAVYAMYINNSYSLKDRLHNLKNIKKGYGDLIKKSYYPAILKMRILKKIFVLNILIFDVICRCCLRHKDC